MSTIQKFKYYIVSLHFNELTKMNEFVNKEKRFLQTNGTGDFTVALTEDEAIAAKLKFTGFRNLSDNDSAEGHLSLGAINQRYLYNIFDFELYTRMGLIPALIYAYPKEIKDVGNNNEVLKSFSAAQKL